MLHVDHVIYGVRDAEAAAARLRDQHGLESVAGGRHPAWGTENRIVPLGGAYLELMTIFDRRLAENTPLGRFVTRRLERGDGFLGWMVAGPGFEERVGTLGLDARASSRERPDGSVISWRLAGLDTMLAEPPLPGLLAWDEPDAFPGATRVKHRGVQLRGFAWLELAGDARGLRAWLGDKARLPVRFVDGEPPGLRAAAIATDGDPIILR